MYNHEFLKVVMNGAVDTILEDDHDESVSKFLLNGMEGLYAIIEGSEIPEEQAEDAMLLAVIMEKTFQELIDSLKEKYPEIESMTL